jgi:DNA recombination-dependent growth factor C
VGLLSRSTSIVRFLAPPPKRLDRDAIARAVSRRAFRDVDLAESTQAFGWVGIHDPLATDLGPADVFVQQHLVVGFRYDRRVVPAKLLYLERRREEAARRSTEGNGRLGREARKQIKAEVEARLVLRALPAPRLFDCAWNLDSGHVYFSGRLRAAREAFTALFRETFGVAPVPLIPYLAVERLGLPERAVERFRAVEASSLSAPAPDPSPAVPRLPLVEAEA